MKGYSRIINGGEVMNCSDKTQVAMMMQRYGGSFASHLGEALMHADALNTIRIYQAFPELIEEYRKFIPKEERS